jgi:hypothetical protein
MQVGSADREKSFEPAAGFARPTFRTSGRRDMNHSIATANRNTHLKIVVVALVAAIAVVSVGITARLSVSGVTLAGVHDNIPVARGVVKADKPVVWTGRDESIVR